ncbi:hypothetical protein ACFWGI_06705 [Streptomyces niveus]|uniref:hypothetical protein n=1 Tax=Streptomyces niveus TaxID=193462 RepID=UPI00364917FA
MTHRDQASDIAALLYPLPEPGTVEPAEAFDDAVDEIRRRQDDCAEQLRNTANAAASDVLLEVLAAEAAIKADADARMRLLLGYARHFVAPGGYPLDTLAAACHLTDRGVSKIANAQIDNVARVLGVPPVGGKQLGDRSDAGQDDTDLRELARTTADSLRTLELNDKDTCSSLAQTLQDAGIEPHMHGDQLAPTPPIRLTFGASHREILEAGVKNSTATRNQLRILSTWPTHMRIEHQLGILLPTLLNPTPSPSSASFLANVRDDLRKLCDLDD